LPASSTGSRGSRTTESTSGFRTAGIRSRGRAW
jgi:hypothetical protein